MPHKLHPKNDSEPTVCLCPWTDADEIAAFL